MIKVAIALFIIAALFGLTILTYILRNKPTPKLAVFIHGPVAITALVLVIIDIINGDTQKLLITSAVIFVLAALGGIKLFTVDMMKKPIPKALALIHPLAAVTGLVILIIYALQ